MQKIAEVTEPYQAMRFDLLGKTKPYQGTVNHRDFNFIRILEYGNPYAPLISGAILESASDSKTKLCMTMRMRNFVVAGSSLWIGTLFLFIGIASLGLVNDSSTLLSEKSMVLLTPIGMFLFGCAIVLVCFNVEAQKSKRFITELLQAKDVSF